MLSIVHDPGAGLRLNLAPHRSLSLAGFRAFMLVFAAASLAAGFVFLMIGAWPVMGWCGLDAALVYFLFRQNYKDAARSERIVLTGTALTIFRANPDGTAEEIRFNPYWARLDLEERPDALPTLRISSHGRCATVGGFLPGSERLRLYRTLREALRGISVHSA